MPSIPPGRRQTPNLDPLDSVANTDRPDKAWAAVTERRDAASTVAGPPHHPASQNWLSGKRGIVLATGPDRISHARRSVYKFLGSLTSCLATCSLATHNSLDRWPRNPVYPGAVGCHGGSPKFAGAQPRERLCYGLTQTILGTLVLVSVWSRSTEILKLH